MRKTPLNMAERSKTPKKSLKNLEKPLLTKLTRLSQICNKHPRAQLIPSKKSCRCRSSKGKFPKENLVERITELIICQDQTERALKVQLPARNILQQ